MEHWHRCRRWWRRGFECPFGADLEDHQPDEPEDDTDQFPREFVGPPSRVKQPLKTMQEMIDEIERAPFRLPTAEGFESDPFGGVVQARPPLRAPARVPAHARAPVRAPVRGRGRVPSTAPGEAPVRVPVLRPRGASLPAGAMVKAVRFAVNMERKSTAPGEGPVTAARAEEATARVLEAAPRRAAAEGRGFPTKRLAKAVGAGLGAAAIVKAARFTSGRFGGGRGGFFFNQAAQMRKLVATGR